MSRDYRLYLKDILESVQKIQRYTENLDMQQFEHQEQTVDATLHNLLIIGEAVKNIPDEITENYAEIEWRNIARFRDLAIHRYFALNLDLVWDIVTNHLDDLETCVQKILDESA